jgi:catechol 2,3-dioxygenase-like lactoylglutathione lyase family enzyme
MTIRVRGVHHVAIVVGDLDEARRFYCDALGLEEIDRPNFPSAGFWLRVGDQQLHVSLGDEAPPRRNHFALLVEQLDDAVAHLADMQLPVQRGADIDGAGRQAFVRDPAGNLVELNQQELTNRRSPS